MASAEETRLELQLSDYWAVVRKRMPFVLLVFLSSVGAGAFYLTTTVPVYRAETLLKFEPPMGPGVELAALALGPAVQTQVNLLSSLDMQSRIAKRTGLSIKQLQSVYKAERAGQSALIKVLAFDVDPRVAAERANLIADLFVDWDVEVRSSRSRQVYKELLARREGVEKELTALEGRRKEFLETHETTGLSGVLANNLLDLESRRKEMLRKFTEQHPDIRKLDQRIETVRAKLNELPGEQEQLLRLNRQLTIQEEAFVTLSRKAEEMRVSLESTLSFITILARATVPDLPFKPRKRLIAALSILGGALLGLLAAFVAENMDISITTIEDIEKVLGAPMLGIVPHFGSDSRWQDFLARWFKKERHHDRIFRSFLIFRHPPKSPTIEVYHSLRVNILSHLEGKPNAVLTFTSTGVAEGKTLTSSNFCLAAAHSGLKTLLIAADVRRPVLHRVFGLPREPGLIEAVTGRVPWRKCLRGTVDYLMQEKDLERLAAFQGVDHLKIMTGWTASTAEVVNLLSSRRLPKLIEEMRAEFDIIVFDCPPVLLFVDAMLIAPHTDGVVLVYKSGKMARRALRRARDQIVVSHGKILGIVLNDANQAAMEPGYGYYSDYGHYAKPPS